MGRSTCSSAEEPENECAPFLRGGWAGTRPVSHRLRHRFPAGPLWLAAGPGGGGGSREIGGRNPAAVWLEVGRAGSASGEAARRGQGENRRACSGSARRGMESGGPPPSRPAGG